MDGSLLGRYVLALGLGYLLGAIPDTYLLTCWLARKDLRRVGTGNLTMTNTYRSAGRTPALLAALWHLLLGFGVVILTSWLFPEVVRPLPDWVAALSERLPAGLTWVVPEVRVIPLAGLLGAFVGQNWTVFLWGAAGRGRICFSAGMWLVSPLTVIADGLLWGLGLLLSRRPAVGAVLSNVALPFLLLLFTGSWACFALGVVFGTIFAVQVVQGGHEYSRGWGGR